MIGLVILLQEETLDFKAFQLMIFLKLSSLTLDLILKMMRNILVQDMGAIFILKRNLSTLQIHPLLWVITTQICLKDTSTLEGVELIAKLIQEVCLGEWAQLEEEPLPKLIFLRVMFGHHLTQLQVDIPLLLMDITMTIQITIPIIINILLILLLLPPLQKALVQIHTVAIPVKVQYLNKYRRQLAKCNIYLNKRWQKGSNN